MNEELNTRRDVTPNINQNSSKYAAKKIHSEFMELIETNEEKISPIEAISIISEIFNVDLNPSRSADKEQICHRALTYLIEKGDEEDVLVNRLWNFIEVILNCCTST